MFHCNQSSPPLSSICCQTLSLFSQCQDSHWIQTIIMHMLIFETNYILSTSSVCHSLNFILCSPNQLLTNHMPLEMKYFLKVLLNHTYFWEKSGSIDTIMKSKMNTWQSLGLRGNHQTIPDQFSLESTIESNEITSLPPLVSCPGIGSKQNFRNIVASDSPLSWDDLFQNCRWLALEPMKTSGWHSLVDLSIVLLYDSMFFSHDSFYFYFS